MLPIRENACPIQIGKKVAAQRRLGASALLPSRYLPQMHEPHRNWPDPYFHIQEHNTSRNK
jgi:hypothetical protein